MFILCSQGDCISQEPNKSTLFYLIHVQGTVDSENHYLNHDCNGLRGGPKDSRS